jgi:hypothetical protein
MRRRSGIDLLLFSSKNAGAGGVLGAAKRSPKGEGQAERPDHLRGSGAE